MRPPLAELPLRPMADPQAIWRARRAAEDAAAEERRARYMAVLRPTRTSILDGLRIPDAREMAAQAAEDRRREAQGTIGPGYLGQLHQAEEAQARTGGALLGYTASNVARVPEWAAGALDIGMQLPGMAHRGGLDLEDHPITDAVVANTEILDPVREYNETVGSRLDPVQRLIGDFATPVGAPGRLLGAATKPVREFLAAEQASARNAVGLLGDFGMPHIGSGGGRFAQRPGGVNKPRVNTFTPVPGPRIPGLAPRIEKEAMDYNRLAVAKRERGLETVAPKVSLTTNTGKLVVLGGNKTVWERTRMISDWATPDEIAKDAKWYEDLRAGFTRLGASQADTDRALLAVQSIQTNLSPEMAARAMPVVLAEELGATRPLIRGVKRGQPLVEKKSGFLGDAKMRDLLGPNKRIAFRGLGAKLADFLDSTFGLKTRSYVGHAAEAGTPAVADVHMGRAAGYVDSAFLNQVESNIPEIAPQLRVYRDQLTAAKKLRGAEAKGVTPGLSGVEYEHTAQSSRDLAAHFNRIDFNGRNDWTAAQAQAVEWFTTKRLMGQGGGSVDEMLEIPVGAGVQRMGKQVGVAGQGDVRLWESFNTQPPATMMVRAFRKLSEGRNSPDAVRRAYQEHSIRAAQEVILGAPVMRTAPGLTPWTKKMSPVSAVDPTYGVYPGLTPTLETSFQIHLPGATWEEGLAVAALGARRGGQKAIAQFQALKDSSQFPLGHAFPDGSSVQNLIVFETAGRTEADAVLGVFLRNNIGATLSRDGKFVQVLDFMGDVLPRLGSMPVPKFTVIKGRGLYRDLPTIPQARATWDQMLREYATASGRTGEDLGRAHLLRTRRSMARSPQSMKGAVKQLPGRGGKAGIERATRVGERIEAKYRPDEETRYMDRAYPRPTP